MITFAGYTKFVVQEVHMAEMMRKYHKPQENVADSKKAQVEA